MSKQAKSKNAVIKKAKKLERQGKYIKALKVCDSYLDNEKAEETIIQLKIDILINLYNNDAFINKINEYKVKLTDFIEKSEEIELLKLYNTLDNYLELNSQNMADERKVGTYLAGGLLVDNLETILVLNEMAKDNRRENMEELKVCDDLNEFVENVKKTTYQYLKLILPNYKELIENSNFNLDEIISKIRHFYEPRDKTEDSSPSNENKKSDDGIEPAVEEELNDEKPKERTDDGLNKDMDNSSSKAKMDNYPNEEESKNTLKLEDTTEPPKKITVEDEIKGLKEIINYLNDKNEFKKALIYQRRLVKLAREENIKAEHEHDSMQKTLSDY
ncbi:MAG: hypothetical protein IJP12_02765 [Methanobrevibacter sp.]|nr:hypothetical protein [Methanobrevibacter sp.]